MMIAETLGDQLRAAREEAGLTQKAVARRLFVAPLTVRRWEQGKRLPAIDMADAYLRLVGGHVVLGLSTAVGVRR
jgi:transcriptional regulator with XRE-family HTH domain